METVTDFIFGASKITADGDYSHDIKRGLLLGRKAIINLNSILKSRDITLPTNVHWVKTMVFPVVMYGYESWTKKKAECQRIDAFKLWCWPWIFIGRVDAETPILWPPDVKSQLTSKDDYAGKDWRQKKEGMTEDEMVGWHHSFNGHDFEKTGR